MLLSDFVGFLVHPEKFTVSYRGKRVDYLDEVGAPTSVSKFFVAGHEFGPSVLIHVEAFRGGDGYESAWEVWIDSCETIPESELTDAYGPDDDGNGRSFYDIACCERNASLQEIKVRAKELLDASENSTLIEGYGYQSNATGTGIVSVGHHAWMHEASLIDVDITRK